MARAVNTKRSDGRLQSKIYLGVVDGKAKYKYVYASTQKQAQRYKDNNGDIYSS